MCLWSQRKTHRSSEVMKRLPERLRLSPCGSGGSTIPFFMKHLFGVKYLQKKRSLCCFIFPGTLRFSQAGSSQNEVIIPVDSQQNSSFLTKHDWDRLDHNEKDGFSRIRNNLKRGPAPSSEVQYSSIKTGIFAGMVLGIRTNL